MGKLNKFLIWVLCVFLSGTMLAQRSWADEYVSQRSGLDVIFVMDYSGSMKSNDSDYIAQGMVKAFIDTVHAADIRIGFTAYNDRILSAAPPLAVETNEERQTLKVLIDMADYSGNTDIGLGLRYAYELISQGDERKKAIILISDGESDLKGSATGRVLEHALQDVEYVTSECEKKGIPIYSVAFGRYDGKAETLEKTSARTGGRMLIVEKPEALIEVLYGIFEDNMDYSIEKIADSIYASGQQDILVKLDEPYVDELDVLLISPQPIGMTGVLYGQRQVETVNLKNYAVAKIEPADERTRELIVRTTTVKNQELELYLIAYRNLTPVLSVDPVVDKNGKLTYRMYFKDKSGNMITDEAFYKNFSYEFTLSVNGKKETLKAEIQNGMICGETFPERSGSCFLDGRLDDHMGRVVFPAVEIRVQNHSPEGGLPSNERYSVLTKEQRIRLDDFFSDPDGDRLRYSLKDTDGPYVKAEVQDGELVFKPIKSGIQTLALSVSDDEDTYEYLYMIEVIPLWKAYWWITAIVILVAGVLVWRLIRKPVPELEQLEMETKRNRFAGRLDAYFTVQPERDEEIPPLSFQMHKVKSNKISIGSLLKDYPDACDALELDEIFLVADEDRRMVIYHTSKASVMIGNSIICRQIQYSVSFGDVIYIASEDGFYDLEIHYISMIQ